MPGDAEEGEIETGFAIAEQVRHDLAEDAGEFEAVPGTGAGDQDGGILGMKIQQEMATRGVGVHANGRLNGVSEIGQERSEQLFHKLGFLGRNFFADDLRSGCFALGVLGYFHAIAHIGEAVKELFGSMFEKENRECGRSDYSWVPILEPEKNLALNA